MGEDNIKQFFLSLFLTSNNFKYFNALGFACGDDDEGRFNDETKGNTDALD